MKRTILYVMLMAGILLEAAAAVPADGQVATPAAVKHLAKATFAGGCFW